MPISDDCASGIHDYCGPCDCLCHGVLLSPTEAQAIWKFLMYEWITPEDDELNAAVRAISAYVKEHNKTRNAK
jgi:hypothetical protein